MTVVHETGRKEKKNTRKPTLYHKAGQKLLTRSENYVLSSFLLGIYKIVQICHFIYLYTLPLKGWDSVVIPIQQEIKRKQKWAHRLGPSPLVCNSFMLKHSKSPSGNKWGTNWMLSNLESFQGREFTIHRNLVETSFETVYFFFLNCHKYPWCLFFSKR